MFSGLVLLEGPNRDPNSFFEANAMLLWI